MPILDHWDLQLTTDLVLRAQGADPKIILTRRPALLQITEEAIISGSTLLRPAVLFEKYPVKGFTHERLEIIGNNSNPGKFHLAGRLIAQHLARTEMIIVMICTIGSGLDEGVSGLFNVDPMKALALDGVGSAAVEMLAIKACNYFEKQAKIDGLNITMPLNPGMVGWPVDIGQPQIFSLLDSEQINVSLTDSWMMIPNKSVSMVLGISKEVSPYGSSCEFCSLNGVCKYQNHYAKED
jgi:hypothetical protein